MRIPVLIVFIIALTLSQTSGMSWAGESTPQEDLDRDGLHDEFEQEILLRFLPRFMVGSTECAGLPAEFLPDSREPQPIALNATIYGQVFAVDQLEGPGSYLEIHYYHLWREDCGRFGHQLDSEYVSVLARSDDSGQPAQFWKALYWYAAAHEGTICDASNGASASVLDAEERGATVWISPGKHASFLTEGFCNSFGCGGDRCRQMAALPSGRIINLGEPGRPMNGAVWADSEEWPLSGKMVSDFGASGPLADCLRCGIPTFQNESLPPAKAVVLGGNQLLRALELGSVSALSTVSKGSHDTDRALDRASRKTGKSVQQSLRVFGGWLKVLAHSL
jgi:hypothetical protein